MRALAREVREDGGTIPPGIATFLRALHTAIEPPGFADETPAGHPAIVEITAGEMAGLMGCSPQYVRRLCASGVLRARRAGRLWLIRTDGQGHHDDED
ncbi:helix-turn-helix domain-containing protein [Nonomuraea rubra]